jgi:hypothetical protein
MASRCSRASVFGHERPAAAVHPRDGARISFPASDSLSRPTGAPTPSAPSYPLPQPGCPTAAFCDNSGAREFSPASFQPRAFDSSDSLAPHALGRLALTPLFTGCGRITIRCHPERREESAFAKCQGKSRFLTPQTPFGITNGEFFRSLFCSCWRAFGPWCRKR